MGKQPWGYHFGLRVVVPRDAHHCTLRAQTNGTLSFVLSLIKAIALGATHRNVQSPTVFEFVKELFL